MKTYWSAFLSLFFLTILTGCGNEQFGTGGQQANSTASPLQAFSYQACSDLTLIKPKVDVLYVVDNSESSASISESLKTSIISTVNKLSTQFDYRIIGTPLISTNTSDFNVMTNSADIGGLSKIITSASQFSFFQNAGGGGYEQGLTRVKNFLNAHKNTLFRRGSHLIIVLVSNGLDADIEFSDAGSGYSPPYPIKKRSNADVTFSNLKSSILAVKTDLNSIQLRMISATAHSACVAGWYPSKDSYIAMSNALYDEARASDSPNTRDAYDLCSNGVGNIFASINSAIQQVKIPHQYKYAPITFANNNANVSFPDIKVTRVSPSNAKAELVQGTDWTLRDFGSSTGVNTRVLPSPGENVTGRYFVEFPSSGLLKYPDCVLVTSVSQTETFNMVVLPQRPIFPVRVFVNGSEIPASALGTSVSSFKTDNTKFSPANTPPVMKTGYFLEITNPQYFYKSGDGVSTQYTPAAI